MEKRLYRSRKDKMIAGVCGGIAEYFGIDPVIVRLVAVLLLFANGIGLLAYIILAIVVPVESSPSKEPRDVIKENVQEIKQTATQVGEDIRSTFASPSGSPPQQQPPAHNVERSRNFLGLVLIVVGAVFLLTIFFSSLWWFRWFQWQYLWPILLIGLGLVVIFSARRR